VTELSCAASLHRPHDGSQSALAWSDEIWRGFGAGAFVISPRLIVGICLAPFSTIGFLFGSHLGDVTGTIVSAIFDEEGATYGESLS
jgi:hypothetical protein